MTTIVGGKRARLIKDSCYFMLRNSLTALGWFDSNRRHAPINFVTEAQDLGTEIPLNTLALADETENTSQFELGSLKAEHPWDLIVDFFAESDTLGLELTKDVQDILDGRFPELGRTGPVLDVYDYSVATPYVAFTCDIERVLRGRAHNFPQPYLRHWYSVSFAVVDTYGSTED